MKGFNDYRLPSLDALLAFDTAARLKSFEQAAQALSLTCSALRKRITGLEQLLGLSLFERQGGSLLLTAHGAAYLEQVTPLLQQLVAIPQHRRTVQRQQRLTLCSPPTFARQVLIPRLCEHSQAHPEIDLQIQLSAPMARTGSGQWDLEICGDSPDAPPAQRLLDERLVPMAAPALLARFAPLQLPRDFARLPLLRSPLEPWQPWLQAAGLAMPEPDQGPALLDLGMLLEAAASAQGVILARPSLARNWLAHGQLLALGEVRSMPSFHYTLHMPSPSAAALELARWLHQVCRDAVLQGNAHTLP
ncbi:LysR family transcriptional regulator [Pseudomonas sp. Fl5BN2]|uniref:LysR substrate-binding domain-containing protein n=1 Tax=unclassified Pseudomonas TaxID=196821 RepID=UPI00137780E1|nr:MULTISPECIES: LysR substrate-binding domain-containing protein [unclassified Pseudomonas]NBF04018.1 LysR family transcriptional regulator [Pseudomonas sp. Fl5BN2]NBF09735.1 LysR family transcriptional regulator [Pseudomonas sp. Fl4BN1]